MAYCKSLASAALLLLAGALAGCGSDVPLTESNPSLLAPKPTTAASSMSRVVTGNFACELEDSVQVRQDADGSGITLTWKGHAYKMTPITTTTGAVRFENRGEGLVWIQIPSKSFLLNSKLGQQLANDCHAS